MGIWWQRSPVTGGPVQWLVTVVGSWFSEKLSEFWEGHMRTCYAIAWHNTWPPQSLGSFISLVNFLLYFPLYFLAFYLFWMGPVLSIRFLFLSLLPFWFSCRRTIHCFSGGLITPITSTVRRAAFQSCRLCCIWLHSYLLPNHCQWMGKRKEDWYLVAIPVLSHQNLNTL